MAGSIGNITAPVNGYITATTAGRDRSYYRAMISEVLQRVERRLRATKLSASAASKLAGLSQDAIRNMQRAARTNPDHGISTRTIGALAGVLKTTPGWLMDGSGDEEAASDERVVPTFLPVRYRVQAGHWYEIDEAAQDFPEPPQPVVPDARFAEFPQWLEQVHGDSVNKKILPGGFAHVVDAITMGYAPRDKDWVVVERRARGGMLRERTIKQIKIVAGNVELWPSSTNPKWCDPVVLNQGAACDEDLEIEIVGLVIGSYSSFV